MFIRRFCSKNKVVIAIVFAVFPYLFLQAQEIRLPVSLNKDYLKYVFTDGISLPLQPARWDKKQWLTAGAVAGVTIGLFTQDNAIRNFAHRNQNPVPSVLSDYAFTHWGDGLYPGILLVGMYATGAIIKNEKAKETALLGAESLVLSAAFVTVAKQVFHRHRPYQDGDPFLWDGPFSTRYQYVSFPSGHTITAFSVASLISHQYKDKKWVPVVCYSVAALTGMSRIYDDRHWASDVFMGAALGTAIGAYVYWRYHHH